MALDRRLESPGKPTPLPIDYLKMVAEVFAGHFEAGLQELRTLWPEARFEARGEVYLNEIVLAVGLVSPGRVSATTTYASVDFDPKASAPTAQDLLALCVDALASLWGELLDPTQKARIEGLAHESLSALENVPFIWTPLSVSKRVVHLKMDKANPALDQLTDRWLEENDPELAAQRESEERQTEGLFVTGPKVAAGEGLNPLGNGPKGTVRSAGSGRKDH